MTYKEIRHNEEVHELLKKGNRNLGLLGILITLRPIVPRLQRPLLAS